MLSRKFIALVLTVVMLLAIPITGVHAESAFSSSTDVGIPLYNICTPAKAAQEFVPDFGAIHTVKAYLDIDAGSMLTLSICTDTEATQAIHTQEFSFFQAAKGWVEFPLSSLVSVTEGQRYLLVLTSTKRTLWFGTENCADTAEDCCAINFDERTGMSGPIRQPHRTAFEVLPEPATWQIVINAIGALPDSDYVVLSDADKIAAARRDYDALSQEDKSQVSNYERLTAAEQALQELQSHVHAAQDDFSIALFQCKLPGGGGQEFRLGYSNLTKVISYLQVAEECDITLKIWRNYLAQDAVELYTQTYRTSPQTGWVTFPLSDPLWLEEATGRYTFTITANGSCVMFGRQNCPENPQGCAAINVQVGVRLGDQQTAFRVEGTPLQEYQKLINAIDQLPDEITLEQEATVAALTKQHAALPVEEQNKVSNYDKLLAAAETIKLLRLQKEAAVLASDIDALNLEALSLNDQAAVAALRKRYEAFPDDIQKQIENLNKLVAAEEKIAELIAADRGYQALMERIDTLPDTVTIASQAMITDLVNRYNALSTEDQGKVENYSRLAKAKNTMDRLNSTPLSPNDTPFTYQLVHSQLLYLLTGPNNKGGQEFVPNFSEVTAIAAYLVIPSPTTITLTIGKDTAFASDDEPLYTEDFSVEGGEGWYEFRLSQTVEVTPEERYDFFLCSQDQALWSGASATVDGGDGCHGVNYDAANIPGNGYIRQNNVNCAFHVAGKEPEPYQLIINRIAALPTEITLQQKATVNKIRQDYDALSVEEQQQVSNYDVLVAAESRIRDIELNEKKNDVENVIRAIDAIGSSISLESYQAILTADQAVTSLIEKYDQTVLEQVTNYNALKQARTDYNALVHSFVMGDVNDDHRVDAADALLALQHSVNLVSLSGTAAIAANVNGDNKIDATDALMMLQYSVQLIDKFQAQPEEINLQTNRNKSLFEKTYQSMIDRTTDTGYASTSITGAYPGMFVRDTSCQILAHIAHGDFDQARNILNYTFLYHDVYNFDYALHVMNNNTTPISTKPQADTTFYLLHAWYEFAANAPSTADNKEFISKYVDMVRTFAYYYFDHGYFNEELGLIRNPSLEHSRDVAYFNAYDLLTNTLASQALHELSIYFKDIDPQSAAEWAAYADKIVRGIHTNLVAEVNGKTTYAEMKSIDKFPTTTQEVVADDNFYIGFSWVNLFPAGLGWYAMDAEIMDNTYEAYLQYGSKLYFKKYRMLEADSIFRSPEDYATNNNHVIGKGLAWEIIYCYDTGRYERVRELISFVEENSNEMYRETWSIAGGGGDTANQEHASWMLTAMEHVCHF